MKNLQPCALGKAIAIYFGSTMLIMSIAALNGYYLGAWSVMINFHFFAGLTAFGILMGVLEAALCGYVSGYAIAWLYNKFSKA